jgi:hypothetical protein
MSNHREADMPFDGADFLQFRLPDSPPASAAPTFVWFGHWRSLFAWRRETGKTFEPIPAQRALATLRVLSDAKGLIAAPEHWIQRQYEAPGDRYCAVGAIRLAGYRLHDSAALSAAHELLLTVARERGFRSVQRMNDRSTHDEVMAAFDEAMAAARRRTAVA